MTQKANFFKLGLFVVLAFILLAAFLIVFGAGQFLKNELLAETCFNESVQGLDIGSEVKYKGIKIGTVKSITTPAKIYKTQSNYVLVTFALFEDCYLGQTGTTNKDRVNKAVAEHLMVHMAFKGLTGAAYLETDYFPQTPPSLDISWTPKNIYIPSRKSSMKRLGDALNQILDNLSQINIVGITTRLDQLLNTLNIKSKEFNMAQISLEAENLLKEIRQTNSKLSNTLGSARLKALITDAQESFSGLKSIVDSSKLPIDQTLKNFQEASCNTKNMTADFEKKLSPGLEHLSQRIDIMLESLDKTAKMVETMVWLNADTINKTLKNFEHTSENLKQLSIDIKHYPGRLLFEKPPNRTDFENNGENK